MKVIINQRNHDFPKKAGDLNLAWYANGLVCIARKPVERKVQKQNHSIICINFLSKTLWDELDALFKKDLAIYARAYKQRYPSLRKRGVSSYAVFLMIIHALIKRFSLNTENQDQCLYLLRTLLSHLSVQKAVQNKLLKTVKNHHRLNSSPFSYLKPDHLNPKPYKIQHIALYTLRMEENMKSHRYGEKRII
jgi:hypothetical protein